MLPKFEAKYNQTMDRFRFGGVQRGDYVEIMDGEVAGANEDMLAAIQQFKDDDRHLQVLRIHNRSSEDGANAPDMFSATVGLELANGMYESQITIPVEHLKVLSWNVPDGVPESFKDRRDLSADGQPQELAATTEYNGGPAIASIGNDF